jgi:hypothetical protein
MYAHQMFEDWQPRLVFALSVRPVSSGAVSLVQDSASSSGVAERTAVAAKAGRRARMRYLPRWEKDP